jgi:hypothetical protein
MIRCNRNAADQMLVLLHLDNGWTVALMPEVDGKASFGAWASHDPAPSIDAMAVGTSGDQTGSSFAEFLAEIAAAPKVGRAA